MEIILAPWKELVGVIESVNDESIIFLSIGEVGINSECLISEAKKNIGHKVSILRTDIEGSEYFLKRVIK